VTEKPSTERVNDAELGDWIKQAEDYAVHGYYEEGDTPYFGAAVFDLRDARARIAELERERDEARVLVRSEQHPDCIVLLRSSLPWLRDEWTKEETADTRAALERAEADVRMLREALQRTCPTSSALAATEPKK